MTHYFSCVPYILFLEIHNVLVRTHIALNFDCEIKAIFYIKIFSRLLALIRRHVRMTEDKCYSRYARVCVWLHASSRVGGDRDVITAVLKHVKPRIWDEY